MDLQMKKEPNEIPHRFRVNDTMPPPTPPSWEPFERLKRLSPDLDNLASIVLFQTPPPDPLRRDEFLHLVACFADPTRRRILRALILELLAEDLADLLTPAEGDNS